MVSHIIALQHDISWENKPATITMVENLLATATVPPGSLVVLPEMFASGFSMNVGAVAENSDGPAHSFLSSLARRYSCTVMGGVSTKGTGRPDRNEAVAYGPDGRELARYCKQRLFSYAGEQKHFEHGNDVVTFEWEGFVVCPFICYDLRFPELFRAAVRKGATLFAVIANWPAPRASHWTTLLTARAIENQAYVVGVNRAGRDPHNEYAGASMILGPRGEVIAQAGAEPAVIEADLDPGSLHRYREQFPALKDMRGENR